MSRDPQSRRRDRLAILLAAVAAAALVLVGAGRYGLGVSYDSADYLAAARHLAAGEGVRDASGAPLVVQPPLYPAVLALGAATLAIDPLDAGRLLHTALAALVVLLGGVLLRRDVRSEALFALGLAALVLGRPLFEVGTRAWSEQLFIVWVLVALLLLEKFPAAAGVAVGLAGLTRYAGLSQLGAGVLVLAARGATRRQGLLRAACFALPAVLLLGGWLARNRLVADTLFGPRATGVEGLGVHVGRIARVLLGWLGPGSWGVVIAVGVFVLVARRLASRRLAPAATFLTIYLLFLLASSWRVAYDPIDGRLLAPIYALLVLTIFGLADTVSRPAARAVVLGIATAWFAWTGLGAWRLLDAARRDGAGGYNTSAWREHPVLRAVERGTPEGWPGRCGSVFTNAADVLDPLFDLGAEPLRRGEARRLLDAESSRGPVCLIWLAELERPFLLRRDEIERVARLVPVLPVGSEVGGGDGIFRVESLVTPGPDSTQ